MVTYLDDIAVYGITAPYTIPRVFLPTSTAHIVTQPLSKSLRHKVARLNNRLHETLSQLQLYLLPLSAVRNQIVVIRAILNEIYEETYPALALLGAEYTIDSNRQVQETSLPEWDRHHLDGYIVYDEYFSVIRVPQMTVEQLLCQCIATTYALLGDLPFTMLAREEIEVLFTALYKMFHTFLMEESHDIPPVPASYVMQEHNNLNATELLWTTMATDVSQRKSIAMFRWRIGHHMFNMLTIFLTYTVENAIEAIQTGDEAMMITSLDQAATFMRAGIACEWYAANFSSNIYEEIVRPSMSQQDVPGGDGFSGDQNAEFNRFKYSKERLKTTLRSLDYRLSPMSEMAVRQFVEMYVQDGEHHVLLASAMTGNSPSIAQQEWLKDLPDGTPVQSAVDFLRDMVLSRRAEFSSKHEEAHEPILAPIKPMELSSSSDDIAIAKVEDLQGTQLILRELDGQEYLIGCTGGQYWAVSAICTHKHFPISTVLDDNDCLVCTKHGAVYESGTGKRIRGPVGTSDLPFYEVINDNGILKIRGI